MLKFVYLSKQSFSLVFRVINSLFEESNSMSNNLIFFSLFCIDFLWYHALFLQQINKLVISMVNFMLDYVQHSMS